jgi:hypothetical protein
MKISFVDNTYVIKLAEKVDILADAYRDRLVSANVGKMQEYIWAGDEAQKWKDTGYVGDAPPAVQIWADAKQWDAQTAAENIITTGAQWRMAMTLIRNRLKYREDIKRVTSKAQADQLYNTFAQALETALGPLN